MNNTFYVKYVRPHWTVYERGFAVNEYTTIGAAREAAIRFNKLSNPRWKEREVVVDYYEDTTDDTD